MVSHHRQNDTTGREAWITAQIRTGQHNFLPPGPNIRQQLRSQWYRTIRAPARAAVGRAAIAANVAAAGNALGVHPAPAVPGQALHGNAAGVGVPQAGGAGGGAGVGQGLAPALPPAQPAQPAPQPGVANNAGLLAQIAQNGIDVGADRRGDGEADDDDIRADDARAEDRPGAGEGAGAEDDIVDRPAEDEDREGRGAEDRVTPKDQSERLSRGVSEESNVNYDGNDKGPGSERSDPKNYGRVDVVMEDHGDDYWKFEANVREEVARRISRDWELRDLDEGWETDGMFIGSGGTGVAILYRRVENGLIVDRAVVKDVQVEMAEWTRWTKWHGPAHDAAQRQHMEAYCMNMVKGKTGSNKIVDIRGLELDDSQLWYRIYMNYCPHKSLWDLIGHGGRYHADVLIPEPALWSIFNDLVDAFLVLEYGGSEESEQVEGWEKIVHRDVKLKNVFLDLPNANEEFPAYPTARLGDFGLVVITSSDDENNPMAFSTEAGTRCWKALEQMYYVHKQNLQFYEGHKLGEKTNVWGIGAIIIRLMNQEAKPKGPLFNTPEDDAPEIDNKSASQYSERLQSMAKRCVQHDPTHRPTLRNLKPYIIRHTNPGNQNDKASGMRTKPLEDTEARLVLDYPEEREEYKIGFSLDHSDEDSEARQDEPDR